MQQTDECHIARPVGNHPRGCHRQVEGTYDRSVDLDLWVRSEMAIVAVPDGLHTRNVKATLGLDHRGSTSGQPCQQLDRPFVTRGRSFALAPAARRSSRSRDPPAGSTRGRSPSRRAGSGHSTATQARTDKGVSQTVVAGRMGSSQSEDRDWGEIGDRCQRPSADGLQSELHHLRGSCQQSDGYGWLERPDRVLQPRRHRQARRGLRRLRVLHGIGRIDPVASILETPVCASGRLAGTSCRGTQGRLPRCRPSRERGVDLLGQLVGRGVGFWIAHLVVTSKSAERSSIFEHAMRSIRAGLDAVTEFERDHGAFK